MARSGYRVQCVWKTEAEAMERKSEDCSRTKGKEPGGHFSIEAKKVSRVKGPESVRGALPTKEAVPGFSMLFANMAAAAGEYGNKQEIQKRRSTSFQYQL